MEEQKLKHVCKFCKKRFACGRSLGGHIRCHLPKPGYKLRENPKKTWRCVDDHGDVMLKSSAMSSSSETETENLGLSKVNQSHGKSKRSSIVVVGNNSHSSFSEVVEEEQQDEEDDVAMCLIMLSRDVGPWGGGKNPEVESSKNKRKRRGKVQGKETVFTAVNGEKMVCVASEHVQKGLKMKGVEVSGNGLLSNDQSFNLSEKIEESTASENVRKSVKMEENQESENGFLNEFGKFDDENVMNSELFKISTSDKSYSKRSKFECTTCNKAFHSYQALGGHKASHKKLLGAKDCATPNSTEKQPSQEKDQVITDISLGSSSKVSKKVVQKHECPFCYRVFPSGQALGGHKRSHLLASNNNEVKISKGIKDVDVIIERSSSSETRDMLDLDLNLPPAHVQEDANNPTITAASSSNSLVELIKPYWWVENPHKNEPFLSLIPN